MLKIIETNKQVTDQLISKYVNNVQFESFQMPLIDNKYVIEGINEYINFFYHIKDEQKIQVGIISKGHLLSEYQQNKLLKTFEDSDDKQIHLLFIDRSDRLLETIISRALVFTNAHINDYNDSKLHQFARNIIYTNEQYQLLLDADLWYSQLYKVERYLRGNQYEQIIILLAKERLNRVQFELFLNLIHNYLYEAKRLDLLEYVFEIEIRSKFQVNLNLQAVNIIIELKNNKEYYERSHWS